MPSISSNSVSGSADGWVPLCCSSSNGSFDARTRSRCQRQDVLRTMLRNQARPLPPAKVRKYRNARSDASCTTSSASCSFPTSQRASRRAASRCGSTTSSKLRPFKDVTLESGLFVTKCSENLPDALIERGIPEVETGSAQANVRERGVGPEVARQHGTGDERGGHRRHPPHAQRAVRETCKCGGEFREAKLVAVHEEVPPA